MRYRCSECRRLGHNVKSCPEVVGDVGRLDRRARYKARMREQGRCVVCGRPAVDSEHCGAHQRMRRRARVRRRMAAAAARRVRR